MSANARIDLCASRRLADREQGAREALKVAREALDAANLAWENRDPNLAVDERRILKEQIQGAKNEITNWTGWLSKGCPLGR